jgi:hypothetical protein
VLKAFWVHLSQKFCLLSSDLAHLCLTPSKFENSTFFVRSQHTKKSHPPQLIRKRRKTRIPLPASAPTHPGPNLSFFPDRRMDECFLLAKLMLKAGDLLLHTYPGHTEM